MNKRFDELDQRREEDESNIRMGNYIILENQRRLEINTEVSMKGTGRIFPLAVMRPAAWDADTNTLREAEQCYPFNRSRGFTTA